MTTALEKYARLEAEARFYDGQQAGPQNVMLGFGARTLVIVGFDNQAVTHWPLASLRALGRPGDETIQLVPDLTSDERVVLSDPEMIGAIRAVCPHLYRRPANRRGIRRALFWAVGAAVSAVLILFVLIPQMADELAEHVPPAREQALGDAVAQQLETLLTLDGSEPPGICTAEEGVMALDRMRGRMSANISLPYPLRVSVVDHEMVNALALPGGRILIFRGLIEAADTPEEVAGVLAHEIGHVVNRDPVRGVLRAAGTAGIIGLLLGDFYGASVIAAGSDAVLNASHQREAERLADEAAYALLGRAGLPSEPFAAFFDRLKEQHGDAVGPLRYIASHPDLSGRAQRAAAADTIGTNPFQAVLDDRAWIALKNICDEAKPLSQSID